MARDQTRKFECFGGPMDGKKLPVPDILPDGSPGNSAVVVHIGPDEIPHFYAMSTRVNHDVLETYEVLEYGGTSLRSVLGILRRIDPDLADSIAADLDDVFFGDDDEDE